MRIIVENGFSIYIYYEDHAPPHCHIIKQDGDEISVGLPLLDPMYGEKLTKNMKNSLEKNLVLLCQKWEELNPNKRS